jgi:hypothetical protein
LLLAITGCAEGINRGGEIAFKAKKAFYLPQLARTSLFDALNQRRQN